MFQFLVRFVLRLGIGGNVTFLLAGNQLIFYRMLNLVAVKTL